MKKIFALAVVVLLFCTMVGCTAYTYEYDENYVMHYSEIRVDIGLGYDFPILHTSDTHLTLSGEGDNLATQKTLTDRKKYFNHQEEKLDYIASYAQEKGYPIVHSGDLIDFITEGNLQKAKDFLQNPDNDILAFTAGNHEFVRYYGATESTEYRNQSLDKINDMYGKDVRFSQSERNGVTFIALDNSYHLVDEEQFKKLKEAVEKSVYPVVLVMHAPLYEESLFNTIMETEDSAYLMAVPEEKMCSYPTHRYQTQKADATTFAVYDYIVGAQKIKAVLAGHIHLQYISFVREGLTQVTADTDRFQVVTFC